MLNARPGPSGRRPPRPGYGRKLLGVLTGYRFDRPPAEPMAALCGLDENGFLHRCRSARGTGPPGGARADGL
ncbi:hypothetical protein [Actinacidiphila sp. bgisy160]|uniref:hypothetical protein n=1 Tax=Actinacidiphila sp. bgisy160 TaxID=3413796 RepID=UPI003D7607B0